MNFFYFHVSAESRKFEDHKKVEDHEQALIPVEEPPHNTNEGSEFLDDAIRIEDLPLMYTEESVAAGSPKELR